MYKRFNPNPHNARVGDCTVRALCKLLDADWYTIYDDLCEEGRYQCDMPSSNAVWGNYLKNKGFYRYAVPNTCPDCYTIKDFCYDHPNGRYVLCTGTHTVAAIDGCYFDTWDSGDEQPIFYWKERTL